MGRGPLSPRAIAGFALVLAALIGLAAVLPGGRIDFDELLGTESLIDKEPGDLSDLEKKALDELIDRALDGELSDDDLERLLDAMKDKQLTEEQIDRLKQAAEDSRLTPEQQDRLAEILKSGGLTPEQIAALAAGAMSDEVFRDAIEEGMALQEAADNLLDKAEAEALSDAEFDQLMDYFESGASTAAQRERLMDLAAAGRLSAAQEQSLSERLGAGGMTEAQLAALMAAAQASQMSSGQQDQLSDAFEGAGRSERAIDDLLAESEGRRLEEHQTAQLQGANGASGSAGRDDVPLDSTYLDPTDPERLQYPTDRNALPSNPTCIRIYSASSTCHNRIAVYEGVRRNDDGQYFFLAATGARTVLAPSADVAGETTSVGTVRLHLAPGQLTPVPSLAPTQRLVSMSITSTTAAGVQVTLERDANDMVWATGDRDADVQLRITWAFHPEYYDPFIPEALRVADVPAARRPVLDPSIRDVGLQVAARVGASADQNLHLIVSTLVEYFQGFGEGAIPSEIEDDILAIAFGEQGCCRHRAEAFTVTAQSLGVPTRMVTNEAHAFVEVWVPNAGWRMIDLGGCGAYSARGSSSEEVGPESPAEEDPLDPALDDGPSIPTTIDMTQAPAEVRRGVPFDLAGTVTSAAGTLPANIPITVYYNRTKAEPGTSFCTAKTDGTTTWQAQCTLPSEAPVTDLQLVARLSAGRLGDQATAPSFSDPQFRVLANTRIQIGGPSRVLLDAANVYTVTLADDQGLPAPGRHLSVTLDGVAVPSSPTDAAGRVHVALRTAARGPHVVEARFAGDAYYGASQSTLNLDALNLRLEAQAEGDGIPATRVTVSGILRDDFGGVGDAQVEASIDEETESTATDEEGAFTLTIQPVHLGPGVHVVHLTLPSVNAASDLLLVLETDTHIDAKIPARWHQPTPLAIDVVVANASEAASVLPPMDATLDATTVKVALDANATGTVQFPAAPPGEHAVRLRFPGAAGLKASETAASVQMGTGAIAPSSRQRAVAAGGVWDVAATITFDGAPLAGEEITLRLGNATATGTSDAQGTAHISLRVPQGFPVGNLTATVAAPGIGLSRPTNVSIGEPTQVRLDAARFSVRTGAGQATPTVVTSNGSALPLSVEVSVAGSPAPGAGASRFTLPGPGWGVSITRVETFTPGGDGYASSSASTHVVAVHPWLLVGLALAVIVPLGLMAWRARRRPLSAPDASAPVFTGPGATATVRLLRPTLAAGVPAVFDPTRDGELVFQSPGGEGVKVTWDGTAPAAASAIADGLRVELASAPRGEHTLVFGRPDSPVKAVFPLRVAPFHEAVDDAFRALMARLRGGAPGSDTAPRLTEMEDLLVTRHDLTPPETQAFRRICETALYAGQDCDRPTFEAFFRGLAEVEARMRRPAPASGAR